MKDSEMEDSLLTLTRQISQAKKELSELGRPKAPSPELITSANLLRTNEYLSRADEKKTKLLELYVQYSSKLELLMNDIINIQKELATSMKRTSKSSKSKTTKKKQKKKNQRKSIKRKLKRKKPNKKPTKRKKRVKRKKSTNR